MALIGIVAAVYFSSDKHLYFASQTLSSLRSTEHQLKRIAVVNRMRDLSQDRELLQDGFDSILYNDTNNLARAWNRGIAAAFELGCDYALIINLDIVLSSSCIDKLLAYVRTRADAVLWSPSRWPELQSLDHAAGDDSEYPEVNGSCFLVDRRLFAEVGPYDEQYEPAYHEDSDMIYRIKLRGLKTARTNRALFYHWDRGTAKGMALDRQFKEMDELKALVDKNLDRYIAKWGGPPGQETFTEPYGAANPLRQS